MVLQGNPKKLAEEIAKGFFYITPPFLKNLETTEIKTIFNALRIVQRDVRSKITVEEKETREKQMSLMRINQAITVIESFAKKKGIYL